MDAVIARSDATGFASSVRRKRLLSFRPAKLPMQTKKVEVRQRQHGMNLSAVQDGVPKLVHRVRQLVLPKEFESRRDGSPAYPVTSRLISPYDTEILGLVVPSFFATVLEPLQAVVDTACVGQVGTEALAAVGLGTILYAFSVSFFTCLQVVTTSQVAGNSVNGNAELASRATAKALWLALICGFGLTAGLFSLAPFLVSGLRAEASVHELSVTYLKIRAFACPAALLFFAATGSARGHTDSKTPLQGALLQYGVNLALDFTLILWLHWGVTGAALAATIGQYVGVVVILAMIVRRGDLNLADFRYLPSVSDAVPFVKAGALLSTCNVSYNSVQMLGTSMATQSGAAILAAHTILRQVFGLCVQLFQSFNIASQSLVATNLGKNDKTTAEEVVHRAAILGVAVAVPAVMGLLSFQLPLAELFTKDELVIALTMMVLPGLILFMPLDAVGAVAEGGMLGALETGWVAKRTGAAAVVSLATLLICDRLGCGLVGIWVGTKLFHLCTVVSDVGRCRSEASPFRRKD